MDGRVNDLVRKIEARDYSLPVLTAIRVLSVSLFCCLFFYTTHLKENRQGLIKSRFLAKGSGAMVHLWERSHQSSPITKSIAPKINRAVRSRSILLLASLWNKIHKFARYLSDVGQRTSYDLWLYEFTDERRIRMNVRS